MTKVKIINSLTHGLTTKLLTINLAIFSIFALVGAYISQYVFGFQPCILCLYQRVPFFLVIGLALLLFWIKSEKLLKIIFFICIAVLAINAFIAFYHVGVEFKFFKGFSGCSGGNLNQITNLEDLQKALAKQPSVKCDEPQFYFLGLTMAFWNMLFCLFLVGSSILVYLQNSQNIVKNRK